MDNLDDEDALVMDLVKELQSASHGSLVYYIMVLKSEIEVQKMLNRCLIKSTEVGVDKILTNLEKPKDASC